jgi:hypothetical protein
MANRIKKKIAERTLELKEKSGVVQKLLHTESKRLAKLEEQIALVTEEMKKEEQIQLELAERGQGKQTAVREAEMFRAKKCSQLEVRLSRTRQKMSRTEDENQQIRGKIDELRRLIMMQSDVYESCQSRIRKIQREQAENLLKSDTILYEKDLLTKKTEEIVEKNYLEVEDAERVLRELQGYIEKEAKASKEFYERQMRETPVFDDSIKEQIVKDLRNKAESYVKEKDNEAYVEYRIAKYKNAFARLRDEAIGDQSFDEAVEQYINVESDCIKIMSFIRAKEVEIEVEEEMTAKFEKDSQALMVTNDILRRKLEEVDVLRRERDDILEEEDRLKREHGKLSQQMGRWATAINSVFKAMSVDLESLGIYGGRVTADADVVMLMGVVESRSQRVLTAFNKFVASGGLNRIGTSNSGHRDTHIIHAGGGGGADPNSPISVNKLTSSIDASLGGMTLPHILGKQGYDSVIKNTGSDEDDDEDIESDDEDIIRPFRSVELKRDMQASLSASLGSPMGMF